MECLAENRYGLNVLEVKTRIRRSAMDTTDNLNFAYLTNRGFSLAMLLAFTKSFMCLVCHTVGLLTPCVIFNNYSSSPNGP